MSQRNVAGKPAGGGSKMNMRFGWIVGIVLVFMVIGLGISTMKYAQINEGERGVIVTQGRVEGIQEPGLFFRPFAPFTNVEIVNIRRQARQINQNVASSDKQLYDIDIQVDFARLTAPDSLRAAYGEIGVSDAALANFLDGYINDALKSASTQFTLDEALSDRGAFAERIRRFLTTPSGDGRRSPAEQLHIRLDDVKVLDIRVGDQYAQLLSEKANLEVQIETEQKRRQQIEAQQSNNLFQAEQEAQVALTRERGRTQAALEASRRDAEIRGIEGRYWRENPELFELRQRELMVQMLQNGNVWFLDPNTNLTLLLDQMASNTRAVPVPVPVEPAAQETQPVAPAQPVVTP